MKRFFFKPSVHAIAILIILLCMARPSGATTAIMLTDEDLIASSRVILIGEVKSVKSQWDLSDNYINTYIKVQVSQVLKGRLENEQIVFKQLGGTVGDTSMHIYGAPEYQAGQRVLLFLYTGQDGTLHVAHLFQGKYDVAEDAKGQTRIKRNVDSDTVNILGVSEGPNITNSASLSKFTKKIKRTLRANAAEAARFEARFADTPIVEVPPEYVDDAGDNSSGDFSVQYTFLGSARWFEPDTGQPVLFKLNTNLSPIAGGGATEINQAFAAWTNVTTTSLILQSGGSTTSGGWQRDGVSAISYNDPLNQMDDPVGCSGTLAQGGATSISNPTSVINGQTFYRINEADVVFNNGFSCFLGISANLAEVATHEIGHGIGFGHSADTNAVMYPSAHGSGRGATLGTDDIAIVSLLYPGTKTGPPPPPGTGDTDSDCMPDAVEAQEGRNPNVKDNDIFNVARLFAMQQYRDFLGREGDSAGISYWTNQISGGLLSRAQTIDNFFNSAEFQASTPITRLYFAYFLRIPDYAGLLYWVNQYRSGVSLNSISQSFAQSPEFISRYGSLTNEQFVTLVYQNVLGRAPDSLGYSYWVNQLNSGLQTRGQVMAGFSESPEYRSVSANKVYVVQIYVGMLRRSPDQGGFDYWVNQLNLGASGLNLIQGFLNATEYRTRFLP